MHSLHNTSNFDPPQPTHPPTQKVAHRWGRFGTRPRWWWGGGVGGVKTENFIGGAFCLKMMILQGPRHPISPIGVCYANDPRRAHRRPCLCLIQQPLFKVIYVTTPILEQMKSNMQQTQRHRV